jgi:hypothetical protein
VPALPGGGSGIAPVILVAADLASVARLLLPQQWGFFTTGGQPAFSQLSGLSGIAGTLANSAISLIGGGGQSVVDLEYSLEYRVVTAPQEEGAFLSYNKVSLPFRASVTYAISGVASIQRQLFFQQIEAMIKSLTLLSLVMPEFTYPSCNITRYSFRRSASRGISMILVDIVAEQVRVTGTAAFSSTASPSGANPQNGGSVQPQAAPSAAPSQYM